ncbi:Protein of unknown function [Chitinophaga costaii]|uniref:DUF3592 domain-containing protein n=1 Tax=Chitinophaga costaii TaxID=1335309 RepID=A0A1C4EH98_9BACT|nr:DUF3592 domain-containing protein [Chitinophaga costaii]PUZ23824.1 DUF3592 domain-containing protein [Chitinophaga costaii]SCC42944.1 Protein of unknown function [Chitinophaga costaii]
MKNRSVILVFNIFLIIGLLFLGGALFIYFHVHSFKASAVKTTGVVEDLLSKSGGSSASSSHTTTYKPVIRYTDNAGATHHYVSNFSSNPPAYKVGESVDVYFDPKHPDDPTLGGWSEYFGAMVLGALGFVFSMVGGIAQVVTRLRRSGAESLKQKGQLVQADLVGVEINPYVMVNRIHPYVIRCAWKDPLTGITHSFKSGNVWSDPSAVLAQQKKLDVYIDGNNPKKYYVDIAFLD